MATIQGVYVALFGRPADPTGLNYFNNVTNNGADLSGIGDLAQTAEYKARFEGMTQTKIIESIYLSLFNRLPEQAGLSFFDTALTEGTISINNIAIAILDGAQGDDLTLVNKKIAAADLFTAAVDLPAEIAAYQGTSAAGKGIDFLKAVTATSTDVDAAAAQVAVDGLPSASNTGSTFTLTTKAGEQIEGTAGDDTFNALLGDSATETLNTFDTIDGGAGNDTLNIVASKAFAAAYAFDKAQVKGVETIRIANDTAAQANDIDVSALADTTLLSISGDQTFASVTLGDSQNLTVGGKAGTIAAGLTVNLGAKDTDLTVSLASAADSTSITVNDTKATTFTLDGSNVKDVKAVAANATTVNVGLTGNGKLDLDAAAATTLDASSATGDLTYDVIGSKALTSVKLGSGDETLNLTGAGTKVATIDAGAGDDTIIEEAVGNVASTITGGKGMDTITLNNVNATTLVFNEGDSGLTATTVDMINTFKTGTDKLDFNLTKGSAKNYQDGGASSGLVDALTNANTAFAASAGKLQYFETKVSATEYYLAVDSDLDGSAEMVIGFNADVAFGDIIA